MQSLKIINFITHKNKFMKTEGHINITEEPTGHRTVEVKNVENIWLTDFEIARLFDVFVVAVTSNIRAIYKSEALNKYDTHSIKTTPDGGFLELYNMEMIAALAFRLRSPQARAFRRWLTLRPQSKTILIRIPDAEDAERTTVS
jgi:hypothetical protein